jgi:hypothetical protein
LLYSFAQDALCSSCVKQQRLSIRREWASVFEAR